MSDNKPTSNLLRGHTDTMRLRLLSTAARSGCETVKLINPQKRVVPPGADLVSEACQPIHTL